MGTAVTTFQLTAATRDQIELALTIDITARINPTDYAIASIASDASDGTSKQLRELETRIAHSLQEIVSKILFEDIPDVSSLQLRLVGLISEPLVGHALIVDLLTVRSLAPTNPEIKSHNLDRLRLQKRAALRVEEEAAENRRLEAERAQKAWETTQQREAHEWEQKQAKLRRQEEDSREQAKHSRDLELSQTEQKFQIDLAKIERDKAVELAKIKRDERLAALEREKFEKLIPMMIKITTQDGYKDGLIDALVGSQRISINSIKTVVPDPTPSIDAPPQTSPDDATDE